MILLLPPSETKRDGGTDGTALDLAALSYPALHGHRRATVAALRALSRNVAESATALKLSDKQRFEIERNRVLHSSPLMPVMDRFTGVLFEASTRQLSTRARGTGSRGTPSCTLRCSASSEPET